MTSSLLAFFQALAFTMPFARDQLKGFEVPPQVQAQAILVILSGCHVLVNAAIGTGKTVLFCNLQ